MHLQPHYITPGSMLAVAIVVAVLSIVAVVARFWIRRIQRLPFSRDDWLLIPALLLTIGFSIALIIGVARHSVGFPLSASPGTSSEAQAHTVTSKQRLLHQIQYLTQLLQILSLGFIKASFIMFYRRIFCSGSRTWFSNLTSAILALIVVWTVVFFFLFTFYCGTNIWAQWSSVDEFVHHCPNVFRNLAALAISDFLMDVVIIFLPVPMISQLNMDWKKKVRHIGIFMLGLPAVAGSTTRMAFFIIDVTAGFDLNTNRFAPSNLVMFWSIIENGAAIVGACLPMMNWLTSPQGLQSLARMRRNSPSFRLSRVSGNPTEPPTPRQTVTDTTTPPCDVDEIGTLAARVGDDIENKPRLTVGDKGLFPRTSTRVASREQPHHPS